MDSTFNVLVQLGPVAGAVLKAILASLVGIFLLIGFIILRRWYRGRYFRRLNERTLAIREIWPDVLSGRISPKVWIQKSLDRDIVESILLDSIEVASPEDLPQLLTCLRSSGLLDVRIQQARSSRGWRKRVALLALGRTRAPEAVAALAESLEAEFIETRTAAVRALGMTGLKQAAVALLNSMQAAPLNVPDHTLKNALANCCGDCPCLLLSYMQRSSGPERELLARVLGELATPEMGDDLLVLSADPLPEVRASAARALAKTQPQLAVPALRALARDPEWFVRLRAVVALGSLPHSGTRGSLVRALCDPNRLVRLRAAWVLARMEPQLEDILEDVVETRDRYALQAFISELERSGEIETLIGALGLSSDPRAGRQILLDTLEQAAHDLEEAAAAPAVAAGAH